jgi:hypothetical protein
MKREKSSQAFEIGIEKLVYGGMGIGRHQGKVVFVPFSIPGDRLLVQPIDDQGTGEQTLYALTSKNAGDATGSNWSIFDRWKTSGKSSKKFFITVFRKRSISRSSCEHAHSHGLIVPGRVCKHASRDRYPPWAFSEAGREQSKT